MTDAGTRVEDTGVSGGLETSSMSSVSSISSVSSGMSTASKGVDRSALHELLLDKMAMESLEYENLSVVYAGAEFATRLDDLCVRNVPGHFRDCPLDGIPTCSDVLASLASTVVPIAVTPYGNADAPVDDHYFVKPHIVHEPLSWLLERIEEGPTRQEHFYLQSQDNNLAALGSPLIPQSLGLAAKYLGPQEAANLWIGTQGTTSRLHNDNYDNIYVQVAGTKRIHLIPPGCAPDVREKMLEPATYNAEMQLVPDAAQLEGSLGNDANGTTDGATDGDLAGALGTGKVLFPTYNPATEHTGVLQWTVDLEPGDVLFLPALWYHQVEILTPGVNMSLNYWHKPFNDERRWAAWNLTRQLTQLVS